MHLLSSHRLSPRHPSIHLPSQWLPLFPSTHYFLFIPLMSQIQIWASLIEHTPLDTAALFEKTAISGCKELGKGNKSTVRLFSKAAGDCKMQKQRETCRLKKNMHECFWKGLRCVAALSHPCGSEPAVPARALLLSLFLLSALFPAKKKQLTANIATWEGVRQDFSDLALSQKYICLQRITHLALGWVLWHPLGGFVGTVA